MGKTSMTLLTLDQQLEMLEQRWFAILNAERCDKPLPENASGEIQFFSTDFRNTYVAASEEHLPPSCSNQLSYAGERLVKALQELQC